MQGTIYNNRIILYNRIGSRFAPVLPGAHHDGQPLLAKERARKGLAPTSPSSPRMGPRAPATHTMGRRGLFPSGRCRQGGVPAPPPQPLHDSIMQ